MRLLHLCHQQYSLCPIYNTQNFQLLIKTYKRKPKILSIITILFRSLFVDVSFALNSIALFVITEVICRSRACGCTYINCRITISATTCIRPVIVKVISTFSSLIIGCIKDLKLRNLRVAEVTDPESLEICP